MGRKRKGTVIAFDPEIHCGAPVRSRDPVLLQKRLHRAQANLRKLKPTADNYEQKRLYEMQVVRNCEKQLQKLTEHPDDRPCVNPKGMSTDHNGEGYCTFHCSCHGRRGFHDPTGNAYRSIRHKKLREAQDLVAQQATDILNLEPELQMLKALVIVFFESAQKNRNVSLEEINQGAILLDRAGRMAERINAIQLKAGVVTHAAVVQLTQEMWNIVQTLALESDGKALNAGEFLQQIKARWGGLAIDANARALAPAHSRGV